MLLSGEPDLHGLAVELGLAGSASSSVGLADDGRADVVALLHDSTESLDRAIRALAPDGYLYWEIDRRSLAMLATTPGRARDRLRAAGLTPLAGYWVGPGWSRPSRFLPIEPPGPISWYLATSSASRRLVSATLRRVLRTLVRWPRITALVMPRFAVVATPDRMNADDEAAGRMPAALDHPEIPARVRSSSVRPILVAGGEGAWGRISLLAFEDGATAPSVVVKIGRQAAFDEATRHEHEVLLDLRGRLDPASRASVPEPIALIEVGRRPAVVQEAARGSSALARMNGRPRPAGSPWRDLELATDWLLDLDRQTTRSPVAPGAPGWRHHVDQPLDRFVDAFGRLTPVERLFERLRDHTTALGAEVPIVNCHRDLGPWNVLIEGETVRVIDWEVARDGPALTDLVYASLHWTFAAHGAVSEPERRQHLRRLLADRGDAADRSLLRAALWRHVAALGVDPGLAPALVVLTVVDQALDRYDRLERIGTRDRDPWTMNRYVGYVLEIAAFDDAWLADPTLLMGRR